MKSTVVITGAAGGLGRGMAISIASLKCYKLALIDIKNMDETIKLCHGVNEYVEIQPYQMDISNSKDLKATINKISVEFGPISSLINNAGLIYLNEIDSSTIDLLEADKILDVNLRATIHCTSHCVPYIKETKLRYPNIQCAVIVICSDTSTLRAVGKNKGIYASSKWGLLGFTECIFDELREYGIKVSAILPGWANTDQPRKYNKGKVNWSKCVQPSDVGEAVKYILTCSDTVCPFKLCLWPQRDPTKSKL
eukprot:154359_1